MFKTGNRVVAFKEPDTFNWAVRPLTLWLRLFAVPLIDWPVLRKTRVIRFIATIFIAMLGFSVDAACHAMIETSFSMTTNTSDPITASDWNNFITVRNFSYSVIGTHTTLLIFTAVHWNRLARAASNLEQLLIPKDWHHIRHLAILCVGILFLEFLIHTTPIMAIALLQKTTLAVVRRLVIGGTGIFPSSGGYLFCLVNRIAYVMMKNLKRETKHCSQQQWTAKEVDRVKRLYGLIIHYVEEINSAFGAVGVILISAIFIRTINNSFFILVKYQTQKGFNESLFSLGYMLIDLAIFTILIYTSHTMYRESNGLAKVLSMVHGSDSTVQNQVNHLVLEVLLRPPRVTAMGFFNLDLHLMPTLIGTTLTYIIILCQFQYS